MQRLHEEISKRMASAQQLAAEQARETQRARASEQAAWTAQMQSEVRAGKAEAVAIAAAIDKKKKVAPDKIKIEPPQQQATPESRAS